MIMMLVSFVFHGLQNYLYNMIMVNGAISDLRFSDAI